MEITNRDDLRVGDVATFTHHGHEFTGPLWEREEGTLFLGPEGIRYEHRPTGELKWSQYFKFVRATREMPPLPTEPGALILVTECQGERVDEPVLAVLASTGRWWTHGQKFNDYSGHYPEQVTEWTLAKVVPA